MNKRYGMNKLKLGQRERRVGNFNNRGQMIQVINKPLVKVGDQYNNFEVIGEPFYKKYKYQNKQFVLCKCKCGTIKDLDCCRLISDRIKFCSHGCSFRLDTYTLKYDKSTPDRSLWQAYPNQEFGKLLVIGEPFYKVLSETNHRVKYQYVLCKCKCGVKKEIRIKSLKQGQKSCGCSQKEAMERNFRKGTLAKDGLKICSRCSKEKSISNYNNANNTKDKLKSICLRCEKDCAFISLYNITIDEYEILLASQQNKCAICGTNDPKSPSKKSRDYFFVDHDHSSGKVRGLLCFHCNTGLGQFRDSLDTLKLAVNYLENHSCTNYGVGLIESL